MSGAEYISSAEVFSLKSLILIYILKLPQFFLYYK